jgi:hypothetical protein
VVEAVIARVEADRGWCPEVAALVHARGDFALVDALLRARASAARELPAYVYNQTVLGLVKDVLAVAHARVTCGAGDPLPLDVHASREEAAVDVLRAWSAEGAAGAIEAAAARWRAPTKAAACRCGAVGSRTADVLSHSDPLGLEHGLGMAVTRACDDLRPAGCPAGCVRWRPRRGGTWPLVVTGSGGWSFGAEAEPGDLDAAVARLDACVDDHPGRVWVERLGGAWVDVRAAWFTSPWREPPGPPAMEADVLSCVREALAATWAPAWGVVMTTGRESL